MPRDLDKALEWLGIAINCSSNDQEEEIAFYTARCYYEMGNKKKALSVLVHQAIDYEASQEFYDQIRSELGWISRMIHPKFCWCKKLHDLISSS